VLKRIGPLIVARPGEEPTRTCHADALTSLDDDLLDTLPADIAAGTPVVFLSGSPAASAEPARRAGPARTTRRLATTDRSK